MVRDMTQGKPSRLLLSFALPILFGNIAQQLYSTAGAIIVGRGVGVDSLAAVGVTGSMNFLILGFVIGLTHGFSILVSQRFGAGDYEGLRKAVAMAVYLSLAASAAVTALSLSVSMPLLRLLNTPENIIGEANLYIRIIFCGIISSMFLNLLSAILRALGDGRTPLLAMIFSSILNIGISLLFVVVLRLGVAGAALATVTAQVLTCIFCYTAIRRIPILKFSKSDWKPDRTTILKLLKLGLPVGCMNSVTAVGGMMLQYVVNGYGSVYVAGYTAASRIVGLAQQPGSAFGLAMATYTGQNLGAGRLDRIKTGLRACIKLSVLINAVTALILIVFSKQLSTLVVSADMVQEIAISRQYMLVTGIVLCDLGLLFIYRSALQGLGNTLVPMVSGGVELLMRITFATILPPLVGFYGICFAEVSAWIGAELLLMFAYYKNIRALEPRMLLPDSVKS